jgi:hypothetical protein
MTELVVSTGVWLLSSVIERHDIGVVLHPIDNDFFTVWREIEVPHDDVAAEVGQLPFTLA